MREKNNASPKETAMELKYCERCGGLWLRPVQGRQIYCVTCARAIAELPPASTEVKRTRQSKRDNSEFEDEYEGYRLSVGDFDDVGGVA